MAIVQIDGFLANENPREFRARFRVKGEIIQKIMADSLEEAKKIAEAMAEGDEFGLENDEVDTVEVGSVWKFGPMFLVTRGGRKMRVSKILPGDERREPDEHGF